MSFPSIIQRIQHVQNYFKDPTLRPKAFWNIICIYVFTPKISQDFPTKDSSVTHKEKNIETRKVENI